MDEHEQELSLSRIETNWKVILQARQAAPEEAGGAARRQILARYWRAVEGYLHRKLRVDPAAADQVCSDFTLRFLEGDQILAAAKPLLGCRWPRGQRRRRRHVHKPRPVLRLAAAAGANPTARVVAEVARSRRAAAPMSTVGAEGTAPR